MSKLIPSDTKERSRCLQWVFAATTSLEPLCNRLFGAITSKDEIFAEKTVEATLPQFDRAMMTWEKLLERPGYVMNEFTIADILFATALRSPMVCEFRGRQMLEPYPNVRRYLEACFARPAFQRALKTNGV